MPTEAKLTPRELDVMRLVADDRTSKEIGRILLISPRTVEMHVRSSMRKLGCATRAGAGLDGAVGPARRDRPDTGPRAGRPG